MENEGTLIGKISNFFKKYAWLLAICFAVLAIGVTFFPVINYVVKEQVYDIATTETNKFYYTYDVNLIAYFTSDFKLNFTMFITLGLLVVGIIFVLLSKIKKDFLIASGIIFLLAMCMLILSAEFFKADANKLLEYAPIVNKTNAQQTVEKVSLSSVNLSYGAVFGIAFSCIAFAMTTLSSKKRTVREIVEEGVLISLAIVLNIVKIPLGPTGGSINFQTLPLMLIALRYGPGHGFIAGGIVFGLITCLTDGYGFACYPFDYLIGFGSVAAIGFFRTLILSENQKKHNIKSLLFIFVGGLLATIIRYIGANVSSIVVYKYSLIAALEYNALYIPISGLASTIALMAISKPIISLSNRHPVQEQEN
ncbi:MAG: energy-coupled thiamine transporter ThiT [Bacilli bacterium]|nr:energy-coupled thiamine transporter ThiT [Bacilli bacterium]